MLVPPKQDAALQQGDIIRDVPFVVFPKLFNVKAEGVSGQARLDSQDLTSFARVKEFSQARPLTAAGVPFTLQPGMIVTQGCDIDHKDQITLARVFPIGHMVQDAKDAIEYEEPIVLYEVIRTLTEGYEAPNLVYLGRLDGLGHSVADLMRVQSYPEVWKSCFRQNRWMSLMDEGLKYVQGRLNSFTGRYALEQGFWQSAEDRELAMRLKDSPQALDEAFARLEAKKGASGK